MCKGIGGGSSQHKLMSPHHVQRDWWGLVPTQINVPTPCVKGLVAGCSNTNQRPFVVSIVVWSLLMVRRKRDGKGGTLSESKGHYSS